jgi:hypothetical protein
MIRHFLNMLETLDSIQNTRKNEGKEGKNEGDIQETVSHWFVKNTDRSHCNQKT